MSYIEREMKTEGKEPPQRDGMGARVVGYAFAIALPGLTTNNTSIDDLFEALELQRGWLKEMQQLQEWG
jgi:hypothetical protein